MAILKRCPFCNKFVWFWQSKCYLDARSKKPCHAYCWVWEMASTRLQKDDAMMSRLILRERIKWRGDDIDELQRLLKDEVLKEGKPFFYHRKKDVEKVEDDTWKKDVKK